MGFSRLQGRGMGRVWMMTDAVEPASLVAIVIFEGLKSCGQKHFPEYSVRSKQSDAGLEAGRAHGNGSFGRGCEAWPSRACDTGLSQYQLQGLESLLAMW